MNIFFIFNLLFLELISNIVRILILSIVVGCKTVKEPIKFIFDGHSNVGELFPFSGEFKGRIAIFGCRAENYPYFFLSDQIAVHKLGIDCAVIVFALQMSLFK